MILCVFTLALSLPVALTHDRYVNFRHRRTSPIQSGQSEEKKNLPFVIRVPNTSKSLFTHSVAWKAKRKQAAVKSAVDRQTSVADADVEVTQFHSQDTDGQVVFGFNSPDQMRIETRNADGAVHGTYSYLDPYGQLIKRQYWDTGAGFHVTGNAYPLVNSGTGSGSGFGFGAQTKLQLQGSPYTAQVQAASDSHFQLYRQALASLLPTAKTPTAVEQVVQAIPQEQKTTNKSVSANVNATESIVSNEQPHNASSYYTQLSDMNTDTEAVNSDDRLSLNIFEPNAENGTILIQNPEYLRISWRTENKMYRINLSNETENRVKPVTVQVSRSPKSVLLL